MKTPSFWYDISLASRLKKGALRPLSALYNIGRRARQLHVHAPPDPFPVPSIVLGGVTMGGSGKTPAAISIAKFFQTQGINVHFISRGYGRTSPYTRMTRVTAAHTVQEVGDEPLLLAEIAPTWVVANRHKAAQEAVHAGAHILILDDGFYNPRIKATLSVLVYDVHQGIGNGGIFPAGPLRAPVQEALARADLIVSLGGEFPFPADIPILIADLKPDLLAFKVQKKRFIAFAGLGYPDKFFKTLSTYGAYLIQTYTFPDHHLYTETELKDLMHKAQAYKASLITTRKDYVRLPNAVRSQVFFLDIQLVWRHAEADLCILKELTKRNHDLAASG
ncbi:MAG: tetraacyldisaccharide 4'-kinase [Holosporales bacterium]|nr:tetraacyldisaccharide 4'-kinase [Holosporales bacterium]